MLLSLVFRFGRTCLAALGIASASMMAQASELPVPVDLSRPLLVQGTQTFVVLQDVPVNWTLAQVLAQPAASFSVFDPKKTYHLDEQKALWLHFKVLGGTEASKTGWIFALPKPLVDRVAFYSRDSANQWQKQVAGDLVPQAEWAIRGLYPQFALPPLAAGVNDFYVKVDRLLPLRFSISIKSAEQSTFDNQNLFLRDGVLLGLLLLVSGVGFTLAMVYRSSAYAWYSVYVVFVFLAIASFAGIGHYAFWPSMVNWAEIAHTVCLLAALTAQLQFCRLMFVDAKSERRLNLVVLAVTGFLTVLTCFSVFIPTTDMGMRIGVALVVCSVSIAIILSIVVRAALRQSVVAWLFLLAYMPLVAVLGLTLTDSYGIAPLPWLPYNTIGFAVGFEVLVLLFALHLNVKSQHTQRVRTKIMDDLDPLTGFLAASQYPDTLAQLWGYARASRQDLTIAYVAATVNPSVNGAANLPASDEMVPRCVRMLRMISTTDDTVARIQKNVFAILMPGISPGPSVAAKLSRLVALGLLRDKDDVTDLPVKFLIAATSFSSYSGTTSQVNRALQEKLVELNASPEPDIAFIKNR